jgi:hypothetical protein
MKQTCVCGQSYWPNQSWIHVSHKQVVVNAPVDVVVNAPVDVVVNSRSKDRHKMTDERRSYVAQKMREYRKRKAKPASGIKHRQAVALHS